MDRLVINIENDSVDMSLYHQDNGGTFYFNVLTEDKETAFELTDEEAKDLADGIVMYLNSNKSKPNEIAYQANEIVYHQPRCEHGIYLCKSDDETSCVKFKDGDATVTTDLLSNVDQVGVLSVIKEWTEFKKLEEAQYETS